MNMTSALFNPTRTILQLLYQQLSGAKSLHEEPWTPLPAFAQRLFSRWRMSKEKENMKHSDVKIQLSTAQWAAEWQVVQNIARTCTASLEEFHVYALAVALRRPIIVIADNVIRTPLGEDAGFPNNFGGVYLPLDLDPKICCASPLILSHHLGHISAVVPMQDGRAEHLFPLHNALGPLEVKFLFTFETERKSNIEWCADYLEVVAPTRGDYYVRLDLHPPPTFQQLWLNFMCEAARKLEAMNQKAMMQALNEPALESRRSPSPTPLPHSEIGTKGSAVRSRLRASRCNSRTSPIFPSHLIQRSARGA
eukprot:m.320614 g.320614  ORF g.320614 m.320614 type:complete len:308 (+) comp55509_c0_seq30:496-1419(+)